MNPIRYLTILILSMLAFSNSWAQSPSHDHPPSPDNLIDGGKNPELIPDSVAYRLYLLTVYIPANSTEQERRTQLAHLRRVPLHDDDLQLPLTILAQFRSQFEAWRNRFDAAARVQGPQFDATPFLQEREDIVRTTRNLIGKSLSVDAVILLDSHIKSEKKFMKVAPN